ncbi:TPA: DNA alkylation repair protein [Photobacterium damselae]
MQQNLAQKADYRLAVEFEAQSGIPAYGVNEQNRKEILESALKHTQIQSEDDFEKVVLWLASGEYLEEQQLAFDVLDRFASLYHVKKASLFASMMNDSNSEYTKQRIFTKVISELVDASIDHVLCISKLGNQFFCYENFKFLMACSYMALNENKALLFIDVIDKFDQKDKFIERLLIENKSIKPLVRYMTQHIELHLSVLSIAMMNELGSIININ